MPTETHGPSSLEGQPGRHPGHAYWTLFDAAYRAAKQAADDRGIDFGPNDLFLIAPAPPPVDAGICHECGRKLSHVRWVMFPSELIYDHYITCSECGYAVSYTFEVLEEEGEMP